MLRQLSETLVELHGQHDDRGLLNPRGHRLLLDEYAGAAPLVDQTRTAWREVAAARKALDAAQARLSEARAEEEFLRHAVSELDTLNPQEGEEAELDTRRRRMQGAERIRDDIAKAYAALGNDGAEGRMGDALRWLEDAAENADGQLEGAIAALGRAMNELGEAQHGVEDCLSALDFNPSDLEAAEERLFAIRGLARKHDVTPDELGRFAEGLRQKLSTLDNSATEIGGLEQAVQDAEAKYEGIAGKLSKARSKAAKNLDAAMSAELAPLKMERAVFSTEITQADPGPEGHDAVAFTVATNPGAPAGPLNKIASGGELSRFLLALKVCLTSGVAGLTLIFDEIDRGVGGATADAVGRRLAALAEDAQVLVVTHSPQVAALGGHHWRVEKRVADGQTLSSVTSLAPKDRVEEIGRMLAGDTVTEEARAAAKALLAG